jgi:hypothetical protein
MNDLLVPRWFMLSCLIGHRERNWMTQQAPAGVIFARVPLVAWAWAFFLFCGFLAVVSRPLLAHCCPATVWPGAKEDRHTLDTPTRCFTKHRGLKGSRMGSAMRVFPAKLSASIVLVALHCIKNVAAFSRPVCAVTVRSPAAFIASRPLLPLRVTSRRYATRSPMTPTTALVALAPSGVDALPLSLQTEVFFGIMTSLVVVSGLISGPFLDLLQEKLPKPIYNAMATSWILLGALFVAAGSSHFTTEQAFIGIYPPEGTWGIWHLPGTATFHVRWTGVAEMLGGLGVLGGAAIYKFAGFPSGKKLVRPLHRARMPLPSLPPSAA